MVTVVNARVKHGYTGWDHLLTGRECAAVIGREFRSVRDARDAADRAYYAEADRRCSGAPVELEVVFANGAVRTS